MKKMILGAAALVVVAAVAVGAWVALRGGDEQQITGTCGPASYTFEIESDDGTVEASFDLQSTAPDETWQVSLEQDGTALLSGERRTDEDAELDVDVTASPDAGDEFTVTATPADGEPCEVSLSR